VTSRVFDCGLRAPRLVDRARERSRARRNLAWALAAGLVLVPLAGAADWPGSWLGGALAVACVLGLYWLVRRGARLGWLLIVLGVLGLIAPRQPIPSLGAGLFVAVGLLCVLWLANHDHAAARRRRAPMSGADREAQQHMGRSGEHLVRATLAAELPEDYVLLNGLILPRGAGDVDHLVVGPSGVFVLETKTMAGSIVCDADGTWRRTKVGRAGTPYGAYIGDPATQVRRNIHAVRECLRRRAPQLFLGPPLWIEGLVVFAHPATELATEHSRVPTVRLAEAAARIRSNRPRRPLEPQDTIAVTAALLEERRAAVPLARSAQAVVELALVVPLLLTLVFGMLALSRVVEAHSAIVTIAHEVARAGALGSSQQDALRRMNLRADEVASGFGLDRAALQVTPDASAFAGAEGRVVATAHYAVDLSDLPLVGWAPPLDVRAEHAEWVDPFRAGIRRALETGP
jgi:Nuclease-related domain/TadE-like protein